MKRKNPGSPLDILSNVAVMREMKEQRGKRAPRRRMRLQKASTGSPSRTSHDEVHKRAEMYASQPKLRRWAFYEFFYSNMDSDILRGAAGEDRPGPFTRKKRQRIGMKSEYSRLSRIEWAAVRHRTMDGRRPRRFSAEFIKAARRKLHMRREMLRRSHAHSNGDKVLVCCADTFDVKSGTVASCDSHGRYSVCFSDGSETRSNIDQAFVRAFAEEAEPVLKPHPSICMLEQHLIPRKSAILDQIEKCAKRKSTCEGADKVAFGDRIEWLGNVLRDTDAAIQYHLQRMRTAAKPQQCPSDPEIAQLTAKDFLDMAEDNAILIVDEAAFGSAVVNPGLRKMLISFMALLCALRYCIEYAYEHPSPSQTLIEDVLSHATAKIRPMHGSNHGIYAQVLKTVKRIKASCFSWET